jgi:predicted  nucleic acid-binding Zn-ribbon protein
MAATRKAEPLLPLQEIDLQVHRLQIQRDEKPRMLAGADEKLKRAKDNLAAVQAEIKALKLESSKRELSVKELDGKVEKLQAQSMTAKKNDEYQAFQKEISGVKADKSRIEDGLLDLMMQSEEKGRLEKIRQEEIKAAEAAYAAEKKSCDAECGVLDREIDALKARRAELMAAADKELVRIYERVLAAKRDGLALAAVSKYEAVEEEGKVVYWQCEGCGAGLNMQDVNLLLMAKDVQFCRSCSRIMYIK